MPLTLIYGTLDVCAESFLYFCNVLGKNQYFPFEAPHKSENRLFSQYHAEYPQHEKDKLINGLINNTCKACVLYVTVAFGIGMDIPSIRRVIHISLPRTMEEYFQEVGCAGRDGLPAIATIYHNCYDLRTGKNAVEPVMKDLVFSTCCKRKLILNYFGHDLIRENTMPIHLCCDNDAAIRNCNECTGIILSHKLQETSLVQANIPDDADDCLKLLSISCAQKDQIRNALEKHMESLYFGPSCVGGMFLATGFTPGLVDKTIECCKENATVIFDIVGKFSS
mgnify:FL=1